jgi:hypothetical protein
VFWRGKHSDLLHETRLDCFYVILAGFRGNKIGDSAGDDAHFVIIEGCCW